MQVRLTEVTKAELPQIKLIDRACLSDFWSLEAYEREIESPHSSLIALMTEDNVVLGFGCLWSILEEAHITILAVRPEYQGQGFGRYLTYGLLEVACKRDLEWAALEVRASNQRAIALYQGFGFTEIGRRRNYYPVTGEDALVLWRKGLNAPEFLQTLQRWERDIVKVLAAKGWETNGVTATLTLED